MGHNIFVSYKYKDTNVRPLPDVSPYTWGRDYVDVLEKKLSSTSHSYYGEKGDDDLSDKTDEYIYNHLKDKIFPTTCTVVLISAGMKRPVSWINPSGYLGKYTILSEKSTERMGQVIGMVS